MYNILWHTYGTQKSSVSPCAPPPLALPKQQGDPTYDVLLLSRETAKNATAAAAKDVDPDAYRGGAGGDLELAGLPPSSLSPMQPFEIDGSVDRPVPRGLSADEVSAMAEALKAMGNTLFKLGDTDAAAEVFGKVLRALEPPPETGETRENERMSERASGKDNRVNGKRAFRRFFLRV